MSCCFKTKTGSCKALTYYARNLTPEICEKCRFSKTQEAYDIGKRKRPSGLMGFYLIFDGQLISKFNTILDIDKWLENYFEEHKKVEFIPRTSLFDDYNVLFINHDIKIKVA